jgi:hypothetical protein
MSKHLLLALGLLAGAAQAQNINIDIGLPTSAAGVPTAAYGAGAAQPGTWNAVSTPPVGSPVALLDLAGAATSVTLTRTSGTGANFAFNNAGTAGDDQALMDDLYDVGGTGASVTWRFGGLTPGMYAVTTYAWAPDSATFIASVNGGSIDPAQAVGGAWPGMQMLGTTFARHRFNVAAGGNIDITVMTTTGFASVNGFQVTRLETMITPYCFGDGTATACPCANAGAAGNGCANSLNAAGANVTASGLASVASDSFALQGSGMPNAPALYFTGTAQTSGGLGTAFGDGLRCVGGTVIRLGTKTNVNGASSYPEAGDLSISVATGAAAGNVRHAQVWYRNAAAFCTPDGWNLSNGISWTWAP